MADAVKLLLEPVEIPADSNVIIGQAHFIKTVEDLYETLAESSPTAKFGLAFCEASGKCLVRSEGTDEELKKKAEEIALQLGAGHVFVIFLRNVFPVNVLNRIKSVSEVCTIYCATANPVQVILAQSSQGKGVLGVIDGSSPKAVEDSEGVAWRSELLKKIGYKR